MVNDIQNSFCLYLKSKKTFILILFAKYLSKSSQSEKQRKYFSHFSVKSTYHDTLRVKVFGTRKWPILMLFVTSIFPIIHLFPKTFVMGNMEAVNSTITN